MSGKVRRQGFKVANRPKSIFSVTWLVLGAVLVLSYTTTTVQAAIVGTGDISPTSLTNWSPTTTSFIGRSSSGTITVDDGSDLFSSINYIGYDTASSGMVTVTDAGSTWTNDGMFIGKYGSGCLNIEAGGVVTASGSSDVGYMPGATGTVTVTGPGSQWTNGYYLYVGKGGNGSLNINDGGQVSSDVDYLGSQSGATGTAVVTGMGSKWTNAALYVGYLGHGTLTVAEGGTVDIGRTLYAPLNSLLGNGTINAKGAVLDADLVFDATHGLQQNMAFGSGGVLSLNLSSVSDLGAGYQGSGSLRIADGSTITSSSGYLGYHPGSSGMATIAGLGSKWTVSSNLYVGRDGSGTLTVADGGAVAAKTLFASLNSLLGNGTISTQGAVLDGDLLFDANHGTQQTIEFGTGGTLNLNLDSIAPLGAGYKNLGTLRIADGTAVASSQGYLGYNSGARGTGTVTGTGSRWTTNSALYIGYSGSGNLRIEAGGQVNVNSTATLGYNPGSSGAVTVTGAGSKLICNYGFSIGGSGNGSLTVTDGGIINVARTLYAPINSLLGNGTITAKGIVLDADLVFDSGHGIQQSIPFGTGGSLNLNLDKTSDLGVGYQGTGTLKIADGLMVASSFGYLGYHSGSVGMAMVTGAGSNWTNSELYVGYDGSGTLSAESGGQISNGRCYIGCYSGSGTVTVAGSGSIWTSSDYFNLGYYDNGTLKVEAGGQLNTMKKAYVGYSFLSTGKATITGDRSKWISSAELYIGTSGNGTVNVEAGGQVNSNAVHLGYYASSTGNVTIADANSVWTSSSGFGVGHYGSGTLNISGGAQVNSGSSSLAYQSGSSGTATVAGMGSKWTNSGGLTVGVVGRGELRIEASGQVSSAGGTLGSMPGSAGTATITGTGSQWINSSSLTIGRYGYGDLVVEAGGKVSNSNGYLGSSPGFTGTAKITGTGSQWTNSSYLYVGNHGSGTLNIEAGALVTSATGYVGFGTGSSGTVIVTGIGSSWLNSSGLYVGSLLGGTGTLDVGCGGLVATKTLTLPGDTGSTGTCNINNGGILRAGTIARGGVVADFNWNDGTIQNYDASTDLSVRGLILKLAASGTHVFNITSDRTGTVDAVLSDATSGGTLTKRGLGALILTGANIYSGGTTVEEGRLKVIGSILNTSGMDVAAGATLELAKMPDSATAGSLNIDNAGTILISAGSQTVGAISGTGVTQVSAGTLTATSIVQDSLFIGTTGAGATSMAGETMNQVPEPGVMTLLAFGLLGMVVFKWRRSCKIV